MIEVGARMVTILRRLHFVLSKSVQNYGRNQYRQLEKHGFEINAFMLKFEVIFLRQKKNIK